MEVMRKQLMVASLVFGTTKSGYAYSMIHEFEEDPLHIHLNALWRTGYYFAISETTSTCLLLDKEKKFEAFGNDATHRYYELVINKEHANYYFFDRFTMSLQNNENVTCDMVLKDKTGKQCSAVEVFTLSIKYLVDHLMNVMDKGGRGLREDDILWVLTIPTAWTDSGKQLMKESAKRAGIHAKHLQLITEPEASFSYCHYISTTRLQESKHGIMIEDPGTKSMVVDLGDKAAYITVLRHNYDGQLNVLCRATGDDCGVASVDDRFCNMLEEIVGGNAIVELKRKDLFDWIEMHESLRIQIERFTTSNTKEFRIRFPYSLTRICEEFHGIDLHSAIDSSSYLNEIICVDVLGIFKLKADLTIKLFTPTIDSIITLMKNTLSNKSLNGAYVSNIIMVGGFSQCSMIQEAVYKAFPDNQIIIPEEPGFSVLKGAVLFGHRPDYNISELCDEEGIGK